MGRAQARRPWLVAMPTAHHRQASKRAQKSYLVAFDCDRFARLFVAAFVHHAADALTERAEELIVLRAGSDTVLHHAMPRHTMPRHSLPRGATPRRTKV
eukprot:43733-Chlamydomonas_euryale.AAC.8